MDIQKHQVLKEKFDILKDSFDPKDSHSVLETLTEKIIIPMLEMDLNEGIEMWEYVLTHYYGKCNSVDYTTLTNRFVGHCGTKTLIQAFKRSDTVRRYVLLLDPYESHLNVDYFIRNILLAEEYTLADELVMLYMQNDNGDNNSQNNLFSLISCAINSTESRWKIKSEGIDLLDHWIKRIEQPAKRAELEVALIDLIECVEGNAPKGAMTLQMLSEPNSLQRILEDRKKRERYENMPAREKQDSFQNYMKKREERRKGSKVKISCAPKESARTSNNEQDDLNNALKDLRSLIGMNEVKSEVNILINLIRMRQLRVSRGLKSPVISQHIVFSGNPGTGKTTVARIIGRIYHALGFLSKGHLVEVDRSGLVAGYIGQTAIKTQEVIQRALGGVLFIDEAYTLAPDGISNDYGSEAIETILKAMEDYRDDFVVIVAGYRNLMPRFINSNPGLQSRFNKYIDFPDYSGDELFQIFESFAAKNDYLVSAEARSMLQDYFSILYEKRGDNFGNARDVRNIFEKVVTAQANRIVTLNYPTNDDILTITVDDIIGVIGS